MAQCGGERLAEESCLGMASPHLAGRESRAHSRLGCQPHDHSGDMCGERCRPDSCPPLREELCGLPRRPMSAQCERWGAVSARGVGFRVMSVLLCLRSPCHGVRG